MLTYRGRHRAALEAATARVITVNVGGATLEAGSGVFLAPGLLATCAHNLRAGTDPLVETHGRRLPARVLVCDPPEAKADLYSSPDVALLEVDFTGHDCIRAAERASGRELYAYGCALVDRRAMWDPMLLSLEGDRVDAASGATFVKTAGGQVRPGSSGGGVIDLDTGELIGLLKLTRGERLDLGALLVPAPAVLASFANAGHDIREANRVATAGADTLAAQRERLGLVWRRLEAALDIPRIRHLQLMLAEFGIDDDPALASVDIAALMLHRELDELSAALRRLAEFSRNAMEATDVFERSVPFATLGSRPWVDQDGVAAVTAERLQQAPRTIHFQVASPQTVRLYVARSACAKDWTLVEIPPPSAVVDPETRLQDQLGLSIKAEILRNDGVLVEADDRPAVDDAWEEEGEHARQQADQLLFLLPPELADRPTLDGLREHFPGCIFAITVVPAALADEHTIVLHLPSSLEVDQERRALSRYTSIKNQIRLATSR